MKLRENNNLKIQLLFQCKTENEITDSRARGVNNVSILENQWLRRNKAICVAIIFIAIDPKFSLDFVQNNSGKGKSTFCWIFEQILCFISSHKNLIFIEK